MSANTVSNHSGEAAPVTLSQLARELKGGHREGQWAYGIVVDDLPFMSSTPLQAVGLVVDYDDDGHPTMDVVDAAIQLILDGVDVTLEYPHRRDLPVRSLVTEVANLEVHMALLPPPADAGDEEWVAYHQHLAEAVEGYFGQRNLSKLILPVSNFVEYMVGEVIGQAAPQRSDLDAYTRARFDDPVPQRRQDALKQSIRDAVMDTVGGEAGFRRLVHSILYATTDRLGEMVEEVKARYRAPELPEAARQHLIARGVLSFS